MKDFHMTSQMKGLEQYLHQLWNEGFLGVDLGSVFMALGIFLFFMLFRKWFYRIIIKRVAKIALGAVSKTEAETIDCIEKPASYLPAVFGMYLALEYLNLHGNTELVADRVLSSVFIFVLFWTFFNLVDGFAWMLEKLEAIFDRSLVEWLKKIIKGAFVFIGIATILEIWGIRIAPIIAGLGLFGVAVALGAQDLFKNLISGILVLAEKRFSLGDWIKVEGVVEGVVESIGFRSTKIRRFDKSPVFVPNSKLSDHCVINFSAMTFRRISWSISLRYDSTVAQLKTVRDGIENYLLAADDFVNPPEAPLFVHIDSFNDSSIDMMVYCFSRTTVWEEWLEIKESLAFAIKEIVENAGTDFAFPSQSLYVESGLDESLS